MCLACITYIYHHIRGIKHKIKMQWLKSKIKTKAAHPEPVGEPKIKELFSLVYANKKALINTRPKSKKVQI